jgi:Tol biopolymer transport system component
MRLLVASTLLAAAAVTIAGGGAAAPSAAPAASTQVRTLATTPGPVRAFAQSGSHLAWIVRGDLADGCDRRYSGAWVHDLATGRRTRLSGCYDDEAGWYLDVRLAGGRAYWTLRDGSRGGSDKSAELWSASADDRRRRLLARQSVDLYDDPLIAPASDGRSVYFATSPGDATPGPIVRFDGLRRTRISPAVPHLAALAAGGGRVAFADDVPIRCWPQEPAWSPDGRRIAFASVGGPCAELRVIDADGTTERALAERGRNPDWSPDGAHLAFDADGAVMIADADGRDPRVVVPNGADPAWSPDGQRLAFVREQSLYVVDTDGSGERLVAESAVQPDWSPDGRRIVFATPSAGHPAGIEVVNADGSDRRSLARGPVKHPAWSPDGKAIAFSSCERSCLEISLVAPDGTRLGNAFDGDGSCCLAWPAWAPDSRRLVFEKAHWLRTATVGARDSTLLPNFRPAPRATISLRTRGGASVARRTTEGRVEELAVTARVTAAIVRSNRTRRLEFAGGVRRAVALPWLPVPRLAGGTGTTLVLRIGREIYTLDARTGRRHLVARADAIPIGLSIAGTRVAWVENRGGRAYVRAVEVTAR